MFVNGLPRPWGRTGAEPRRPKEEPYERTGLDYVRAPKGVSVARDSKDNAVLMMRVGEETVRVPENLFSKSTTGKIVNSVSPLIRPDRCYLALHEEVGYPYKLACLDRKTGKVLWKSDVFSHFWVRRPAITQCTSRLPNNRASSYCSEHPGPGSMWKHFGRRTGPTCSASPRAIK